MDVRGTVTKICKAESGTSKAGKEWNKQVIVVDTGAEYNPEIAVQAFGDDKIKQLSKLSVGDEVSILCNVSSREYNGKYFHNIDGYMFSKNTRKANAEDVDGHDADFESQANAESDDLPF